MNKYLFSFLLVFNSLLLAEYEDNNPTLTTSQDLETLKKFKDLLYSKTNINDYKCDQENIISFINSNKIEKFDYNRLLINLNTQINSDENFSDENGAYRERDRASIRLNATYPIFDKKTDLEIHKKKIEFRSKLIDEVSKYCQLKIKEDILVNKIDLLNLKQIRAKAREDSGQIYLDDRITIIESIIENKNDLNLTRLEINTIKLQLLNKVKNISKTELRDIL